MMTDTPKKARTHARKIIAWLLLLALWLASGASLGAGTRYTVDFTYLHEEAPASVAWLYQPGTTINQPVMHSDTPSYYLRRQFNDHLGENGGLYVLDSEMDLTAPVVTIYGKNCTDYSLFGSLSLYMETEGYYAAHPTLYLLTPDGDYQLDIFAGVRLKYGDNDWRVSSITPLRAAYDLPRILEMSFLTPDASLLPDENDDWAILSTAAVTGQGSRYALYARKRPIAYTDETPLDLSKAAMDSRETRNGFVSVEGVGEWMYYSQTDPIWDRLTFEVATCARKRPFGDGGCGPTAVAMAIVNLLEPEELPKLNLYALSPYGFRFCVCSVNEYWCSGKHLKYRLQTAEEFVRYLPVAVASFATGNNIWGVKGRTSRFGTNMHYLEKLCEALELSVTQTYKMDEALAGLRSGGTMVVACASGRPFTKTSHFLVMTGVDEEYLYILDPLRRESYEELDRKGYLELLAPGLVRVRLENVSRVGLAPMYLITRKPEAALPSVGEPITEQPEATELPAITESPAPTKLPALTASPAPTASPAH